MALCIPALTLCWIVTINLAWDRLDEAKEGLYEPVAKQVGGGEGTQEPPLLTPGRLLGQSARGEAPAPFGSGISDDCAVRAGCHVRQRIRVRAATEMQLCDFPCFCIAVTVGAFH